MSTTHSDSSTQLLTLALSVNLAHENILTHANSLCTLELKFVTGNATSHFRVTDLGSTCVSCKQSPGNWRSHPLVALGLLSAHQTCTVYSLSFCINPQSECDHNIDKELNPL